MMQSQFDIVIVGAGPAGMSAAIEAAKHGATVCLLDEQQRAGGQIYRNVAQTKPAQAKILGKDYLAGGHLVQELGQSAVDHRAGVTVWNVGEDGAVTYSRDERAGQVHGQHVIIANGATERPVPIPGWTLPGVITAGAAQIMMKSDGLVAQNAVLVGSGPLLYLVATQLLAAGAPPKALVETQTRQNLMSALPHFLGAVKDWKQLGKGMRFLLALKRAKVPRYTAASEIAVEGTDHAQAVTFRAGGTEHRIETDMVLLHQGVVPNTQISRSLKLDHRFDDIQRCFHPVIDALGQSSHPLFSLEGDGAGIGAAQVAALSGRLAALNALAAVGQIDAAVRDTQAAGLIKARRSELSIRPFLDVLYTPPEEVFAPADDTIICRCEEVRAGDIRKFAAMGCDGPNRTKVFSRCGMGPCQGRNCGLTVTEILAAEHKRSQNEIGAFRMRAPLKPVTLSELSALSDTIHQDKTQ